MTHRINITTGISVMVFSLLYLFFSMNIESFRGIGAAPLDSAFVPRLWGVCMLLLSTALTLRGFRERKAYLQRGGSLPPVKGPAALVRDNAEVILTFAAITVYIALLKPVGFVIMSAAYLFAQILILTPKEKRNPLWAGVTGIVAAVVVDYVFVALLHVMLPRGILGF